MDQREGPPPPPTPGQAPDDNGTPSVWTPPDAAAAYERMARESAAASGYDVEVEPSADGPPPPPFVRQRRRRRRNLLVAVAVIAVIGTPIALAVAGGLATDDPADGDAAPPDAEDDPESPRDPDGSPRDLEVEPLDLDGLDGLDAVYGQLLTDIDASEQAMIAFQDELDEAFQTQDPSDPDALAEAIGAAAGRGHAALLDVRERLDDELDDDGAEAVRESYVLHLDSWADYMAAIADDPTLLGSEDDDAAFSVNINATASAFARELEERLPDDIDDEVRRFADGLLDRGFRGSGDADV